jgi:hypothetical protein
LSEPRLQGASRFSGALKQARFEDEEEDDPASLRYAAAREEDERGQR